MVIKLKYRWNECRKIRLGKLGVWEGFEGRLVLEAFPTIPFKQTCKTQDKMWGMEIDNKLE